MSKITIDRFVVEQALEMLNRINAADEDRDFLTEDGAVCTIMAIDELDAAIRAALDQQQVEAATGKDYLQVPAGFVLLQTENGKPVYSACLDGGRFHGWLMWKHPDGQWVSKRKLKAWEIMQAEDQRDYGIVQGDTDD